MNTPYWNDSTQGQIDRLFGLLENADEEEQRTVLYAELSRKMDERDDEEKFAAERKEAVGQ